MIVNYRIFIFKAATEPLFFTIMVILSIKKLTAANAKFMSERKKRRLDLMMVAVSFLIDKITMIVKNNDSVAALNINIL